MSVSTAREQFSVRALIATFLIAPATRIRRLCAHDLTCYRRAIVQSAIAYIRSAPLTYIYLFVLLITTWALQTASAPVAHKLLVEQSTNLHDLGRNPVRVLVASAFWLTGSLELVLWLLLFSLVMAPVERWLGSLKTGLVFALGHVGASLVTAAGLWLLVDVDLIERKVTHAVDVGASYGFVAVAALLIFRLHGRAKHLYVLALVGFLGIAAAWDQNFTAFGHIVALATGLAVAPLFVPKVAEAPETSPVSEHEPLAKP
jgi:membrane associated rhomboid family serine protease